MKDATANLLLKSFDESELGLNELFSRPLFACAFILTIGDSLHRFQWRKRVELIELIAQTLLSAAQKFPCKISQLHTSPYNAFDKAYLDMLAFFKQQSLNDAFFSSISIQLSQLYLGFPDVFMRYGVAESLIDRVMSRRTQHPSTPSIQTDWSFDQVVNNKNPADARWTPEECDDRISVMIHYFLSRHHWFSGLAESLTLLLRDLSRFKELIVARKLGLTSSPTKSTEEDVFASRPVRFFVALAPLVPLVCTKFPKLPDWEIGRSVLLPPANRFPWLPNLSMEIRWYDCVALPPSNGFDNRPPGGDCKRLPGKVLSGPLLGFSSGISWRRTAGKTEDGDGDICTANSACKLWFEKK